MAVAVGDRAASLCSTAAARAPRIHICLFLPWGSGAVVAVTRSMLVRRG